MQYVELFFRWAHVISAILWIGQVYFFNLIFVHLLPLFDKETTMKVNPALLGRVLWWFKWAAMTTLLFGLALYVRIYLWAGDHFGPSAFLLDSNGSLTHRSWWIHMGILLGIVMWALVWFAIVPTQQKVLPRVAEGGGPTPAELRRIKMGVPIMFLSGPAVFGMLGASHYSSFNVMWVVSILLPLPLFYWAFVAARAVRGYEKRVAADSAASSATDQRP